MKKIMLGMLFLMGLVKGLEANTMPPLTSLSAASQPLEVSDHLKQEGIFSIFNDLSRFFITQNDDSIGAKFFKNSVRYFLYC